MRNRSMVHRLGALAAVIAMAASLAWADTVVPVNTKSGITPNDSVPWSQLGADGTNLASSFGATSQGGTAVTVTLAGSDSLASVVCPAAASCSWNGTGFTAGDTVIWTSDDANGGNGPITLNFGASMSGVGALIQADGPGQFTVQAQAFNGASPIGLQSFTSNSNGDAVYAGLLDESGMNITSVTYSLTACQGNCNDFAIDTVDLSGPPVITPTPTPAPTPVGTLKVGKSVKFHATGINLQNLPGPPPAATRTLKLHNSGKAPVVVSVGALSAPFTVDNPPSDLSIAPGETQLVTIEFSPTAIGSNGPQMLDVTSNDLAHADVQVPVSGLAVSGKLSVKKTVSFPSTMVGQITPATLLIKNAGKGALNVSVTQSLTSPFQMTSGVVTNELIPPKGSIPVTLQFQPTVTGAATPQTLTITSDDSNPLHQTVIVTLKGKGK